MLCKYLRIGGWLLCAAAGAQAPPAAAQAPAARALPPHAVQLGSPPVRYSLDDIAEVVAADTVEVRCDPVFNRSLAFTGFRLSNVAKAFFANEAGDTLVFDAIDGYLSLLPRSAASDPRALLAFANTPDGASWLPAGEGTSSFDPGPLYLVWEGAAACDPSAQLPWPYQVRSISIVRRAELFATIQPDARDDPAPAVEGFRTFETYCFSCHRIGDVGGRVGPPLVDAGGALTNRLPEATARAYILDAPSANPATKMPSFAQKIDSSAYEKLIAYIEWAGSKAAKVTE